jgi:hypothetical protein
MGCAEQQDKRRESYARALTSLNFHVPAPLCRYPGTLSSSRYFTGEYLVGSVSAGEYTPIQSPLAGADTPDHVTSTQADSGSLSTVGEAVNDRDCRTAGTTMRSTRTKSNG